MAAMRGIVPPRTLAWITASLLFVGLLFTYVRPPHRFYRGRHNNRHTDWTGSAPNLDGGWVLRDGMWTDIPASERPGLDLRNAELTRFDLCGADLSAMRYSDGSFLPWPSIEGAQLARCNLRGISLVHTDAHYATLIDCDLTDANLQGAALCDTRIAQSAALDDPLRLSFWRFSDPLPKSLMKGCDLRGAWLLHTDLSTLDLTGVRLSEALYDFDTKWPAGFEPQEHGARLRPGAELWNPDQHGVRWTGLDLRGARFPHVDFRGANLAGANLGGAVFLNCSLRGADLTCANLSGADLCTRRWAAKGVDFTGANLSVADLRYSELAGADLTDANLSGALLSGALYDRFTRWPAHFDPRAHGASRVSDKDPAYH